jgi:hypothetical protein
MFTRKELIEVVLIGATGGVFGACVIVATRLATDPGDVLGFFGGAVGAGLAVVGALWVDRRKAGDRRKLLADSLVSVGVVAAKFESAPAERVPSMLLTLRQTIQTFDTVRTHVGVDDALIHLSMSVLIHWFPIVTQEIDELLEQMSDESLTPAKAKAQFLPKAQVIYASIESTISEIPLWPKSAKVALQTFKPSSW